MVAASPPSWTELESEQRSALAVDGVEPHLHARPASSAELAEVLRQASAEGLAVSPRGGGSRLGLGNRPSRLDLVVETSALDRAIEYEPADLTVTVEAGMRLSALQELLRAQGQLLALDPPARPESTVGGAVASNASGPLRFQYGTARDLVIGTRVANADGRLTKAGGRVVKNVAGYDLNKLYVGSLGTLGVIVELSFRLNPIPPFDGLVFGHMPDAAAVRALLGAVLHSPLSPLAVELLGAAAAEAVGLPAGLVVALRAGGYEAAVERQVRDLRALVGRHGGQVVQAPAATWDAMRQLSLRDGADLVVKAAAPIAQATPLVELLERSFRHLKPVVWSHAGNGIAYAACSATDDPSPLAATLGDARTQVVALGGGASLVVERAPASLKAVFDAWGDAGSGLPLMRALKQQFDPRGTLNPGRFVGGL